MSHGSGDDHREKGFTLVELLMMMVIVGVLAGLGFVAYANVQERASQARADAYWHDLMTAARAYDFERGGFPSDIGDLLEPVTGDPYLEASTWEDDALPYGNPGNVSVYFLLLKEEEIVCAWFAGRDGPVGSRYNGDACEM